MQPFDHANFPMEATQSCAPGCFARPVDDPILSAMKLFDPNCAAAMTPRIAGGQRDAGGVTRRAFVAAFVLAAGWTATGRATPLLPSEKLNTMPDPRVTTYETYLSAWSAIADEERMKRLRESVTTDIVFTNPQQTRHGIAEVIEHLQGFQKRTPGGSFRMNNMLGWDDHALVEWQLVDGAGNPGFSGYDVVAFDANGLITTILLFANVEAQKLAWRRRDPVELAVTE